MAMTQIEARQHALAASRGNLRSLEIVLRELIGGDVSLDNQIVDDLFVRGISYKKQATPETAIGTVTLTAAQMIGGVLVCTPTTTATYTTLTGALLLAALNDTHLALDDSFDLIIINLGGTGDIITMAGGDDVTFVGSVTVDDAGADINSSGIFRFRQVTAGVFVAYRIA